MMEINQYIKMKWFLVHFFLRFLKYLYISFKNAHHFYESIQDILVFFVRFVFLWVQLFSSKRHIPFNILYTNGSHGIKPTAVLKLYSSSPGPSFNPFYNLQWIKLDKERKNLSLMHTKTFNTFIKNGFNPVLASIPRLPHII